MCIVIEQHARLGIATENVGITLYCCGGSWVGRVLGLGDIGSLRSDSFVRGRGLIGVEGHCACLYEREQLLRMK